jgi:Ca2+-binding EF-hand superfamily protein
VTRTAILTKMSTNTETVFDAVSESLKPSFASSLDPALVKQVSDAFAVFESPENGAVDVREVGTIIRSLGNLPLPFIQVSIDKLANWQ